VDTELNTAQTVQIGDLALFIDPRGKKHLVQLYARGMLQTNHGQVVFSELVGQPWGSIIKTHLGKPFIMLQPSLNEILLNIKRTTSIMYPKDIGYILLNMNIGCGDKVIEAGTGSGALTVALCWAVGIEGHVYSYDTREKFKSLAQKNVRKIGFSERVSFTTRDVAYGFDETGVDSVFLDLPNPEDYLPIVRDALKPGGFFGSLVPTVNQVTRLLEAMQAHDFSNVEVCEIMLRYYKSIPARLRPDDRMTAHTGFLIFARPVIQN